LNRYLHSDTSEAGVNINASVSYGSEKFLKKTAAVSSKLIIAIYGRLS